MDSMTLSDSGEYGFYPTFTGYGNGARSVITTTVMGMFEFTSQLSLSFRLLFV